MKDVKVMRGASGKRRRMDEDLRAALGSVAVDSGLKSQTVLSVLDCGNDRSCYDSMIRKVKESRQASKDALLCTGVVSWTDDGSSHGKPAESTLLSIIWDYEAKLGTSGQPMVFDYQLRKVCFD